MEELKVKYLYDDLPELKIPESDSGIDIYSNEDIVIPCGEARFVHTGVFMSLPKGWWLEVKDRSSVSKWCHTMAGVIDQEYRGEILINLYCHTVKFEENISEGGRVWYDRTGYTIKRGHKVAQLIIRKNYNSLFSLVKVDELDETDRNESGFGSTGV